MNELQKAFVKTFRNRRVFGGDPSICRWLDHNSIIEFTLNQETNNNAEFIINGDKNHLIWYSQLAEIFYDLEKMRLGSGGSIRTDGTVIITSDLSPKQFIEYVRNKKFRVEVEKSNVAKFNKDKLGGFNCNDACNFINDLVAQSRFDEAASFLESGTCYILYEI